MKQKIQSHLVAGAAIATVLAIAGGSAQAAAPKFVCKALMDDAAAAVDSQTHTAEINSRGEVVGFASAPLFGSSALGSAIWGKDRQARRLSDKVSQGDVTLFADAYGVNDSSQVVGVVYDRFGHPGAVTWVDGALTKLGGLSGAEGLGVAAAINNRGKIVGVSELTLDTGAKVTRATVWDNGKIIDLGAIDKNGSSGAIDVNGNGVVVGTSTSADGKSTRPVRWDGRKITALSVPNGARSAVAGINREGVIIGQSTFISDGSVHGTAWRGEEVLDLGVFGDNMQTQPTDINTAGAVVGLASKTGAAPVALYWANVESAPVDLNTLVTRAGCVDNFGVKRLLTSASGINDKGVIAATAQALVDGNLRSFSFKLTPRLIKR
jgi:probable HAF family extracellular repeat protein